MDKWEVRVSTDPLHVYPGRGMMELRNWDMNIIGWRLRHLAWGMLSYPKNERRFNKALEACQYVCDRENAMLERDRQLVDSLGL